MTVLIFALVIGGVSAMPALGKDNYRRKGRRNAAGTIIAAGTTLRRVPIGPPVSTGLIYAPPGCLSCINRPASLFFSDRHSRRILRKGRGNSPPPFLLKRHR
jgi:hypothetical protein